MKKRNLDEIMDNVDNAQEGEIPDDAAEAVAGGMYECKPSQRSVPEYHTGVRSNTGRNR